MKGYNSLIKARGLGTAEADSSQCCSLTLPAALSALDMTPFREGVDKRLSRVTKDRRVSAPYTHYYSLQAELPPPAQVMIHVVASLIH